MTLSLWIVIILIVVAAATYLIREVVIARKSRPRRFELKRHIEMIDDLNGCSNAMEHYEEACHISEHYGIPFQEARALIWKNGSKLLFMGDEHELYEMTMKSLERAELRKSSVKAQLVLLSEHSHEQFGKPASA